MESKTTQKGNSRLLFEIQQFSNLDISKSISNIDSKIEGSTQLQRASNEIVLLFNEKPESPNFSDAKVKVAREIIGFDSNTFSALNYQDFSSTEVQSMTFTSFDSWESLLEQITEQVQFSAGTNTWRIVFKSDFSSLQVEF